MERRATARSGSSAGTPSASNIITELTIAGKIAPSPSSPFRRSLTKATASSIAFSRARRGNIGSARRSAASAVWKK